MRKFHIIIILFACLLMATLAFGQTTTGGIYGNITDEQDAVLPGVLVTLASPSISPRTFNSTALGIYRFAQLPPGLYELTFKLDGFQTQVQQDVRVTVGVTATLNIVMRISAVEEVITVKAQEPVVNPKKSGVTVDMSQEILANIPSARDPWVILEQVGGVTVDRVNVGGSESGQQAAFGGRGASDTQNVFTVDGINLTDMSATGYSMIYYDFDAFEEIQVTTAGADPSIQTGGVAINFITKQGGNNFRGQFSFYGTSERFQSDNRTQQLIDDGYSGNKIASIRDYGFNFGGPIVEDKAWLWGSYGVQDIKLITITGASNDTWLEDINLKFHAQATEKDKVTFFFTHASKIKKGRGASVRRPSETTWDQKMNNPIYKIELQHIFNENFLLSAAYSFVDGGFIFDPKGGMDIQPSYDIATRVWGRTHSVYDTKRPQHQAKMTGNYYLEEAMGGDHEFKFGFDYAKAAVTSISAYGGNTVAVFNNGVPWETWLNPYSYLCSETTYISLYLGDTFTKGRLTLNLGVRYDRQEPKNPAIAGEAHPFAPEIVPGIDFPGNEPGYVWNDISPRLGLTYDITGDGKTLIRGSFARYSSQMGSYYASQVSPLGYRQVNYAWNDANGDGFVSVDELAGYPNNPTYWTGVDLDNPSSVTSPNTADPDLSAPKTSELIVGVEREIIPQFSLGANFIYRRYTNFVWYPATGVTSADWSPFTYTDPDYPQYTVTYYTLNFSKPSGTYQTNISDFRTEFMGFELTFVKRLSDKWMLNGSFSYHDHVNKYDSSAGWSNPENLDTDPTNVAMLDGQYNYNRSYGAKGDVFVGSKWMFKMTGMYQLPHGINVSGFINARQGTIVPYSVYVPGLVRGQGVGGIQVFQEPFGTYRLPTFWMVDFRVAKTINAGQYGNLELMIDFFNLFNNNMALGYERQLNSPRTGEIYEIVNPRVFRLGARFSF